MLVLHKALFIYPMFRPAIRGKFDNVPGGSGRFTLGRAYEVLGSSLENGVYKWLIANNYGDFEWVEHHMFSSRPTNEHGQYTDLNPPSNLPLPVKEYKMGGLVLGEVVPATAEGKAQKSPKKVQNVTDAE